MQRLTNIRSGTVPLNRVVDICQQTIIARIKDSTIKRCSSNNAHNNKNELGMDIKSYKPSTTKTETHVPDDLKGHQSIETIDTPLKSTATLTGGGKVWSVQNPDSVHIAPLGAATTTFVPSSKGDGKAIHETTVHTTQGELNIADPFKTHVLQPTATSAQLAESEAASAFDTFAPDTPMTTLSSTDTVFAAKASSTNLYSATASAQLAESEAASAFETFAPHTPMTTSPATDTVFVAKMSSTDLYSAASTAQLAESEAASAFETLSPDTPMTKATDTVFAPKMSSTDLYSATSSPTAQFESSTPSSSTDTTKYETTMKSEIFGGQDTSASSKKHPQGGQYATNHAYKTNDVQEVPIQRESDIRDEILRESLKYVNEQGWTMNTIRTGVRASNQPTTVEGLFSNGYDLVEYFMRDANAKMVAYMNEKMQSGDKQGAQLLIDGLKYRLSLVIPYASTWDQALAQGALPQNAMRGWKNLLDLASDAWHSIGDTSTDINWYTKRLLLATVYKSAEIYMIQDQSPDKVDTMKFLERRLSDFQTMSSVRNSVSKSLSDTAHIASGLFSVVRNLTSRR